MPNVLPVTWGGEQQGDGASHMPVLAVKNRPALGLAARFRDVPTCP